MIKRDLTGKRFGRLIVLERDVEKHLNQPIGKFIGNVNVIVEV